MTLNDLLSGPTHWSPIFPNSRHIMPTGSQSSPSQQTQSDSSLALQTLVLNLRQQQAQYDMLQMPDLSSELGLFPELRLRVDSLSMKLPTRDAALAQALVSLLIHFSRLSNIYAASCHSVGCSSNQGFADDPEFFSTVDLFDTLKRQLSDLQMERLTSQTEFLPKVDSPSLAVESALLWTRIDEELETVVTLCKECTENPPCFPVDHLPPQYDEAEFAPNKNPPGYESNYKTSMNEKVLPAQQAQLNIDEKMRLDLDGVTRAIDRLYEVAPQLHNQRVELKSSKLAELEKARKEGGTFKTNQSATKNGKQKEHDTRQLEDVLDPLGKVPSKSLLDQAVIIKGGIQSRLEKARKRDLEQVGCPSNKF